MTKKPDSAQNTTLYSAFFNFIYFEALCLVRTAIKTSLCDQIATTIKSAIIIADHNIANLKYFIFIIKETNLISSLKVSTYKAMATWSIASNSL